jgi:DNA (cytosine-5)-methyltransferase 1
MGWQPAGFSEIEPFPSAVLAHHYPQIPNLGDMTKYKEWDIGAIDLLVGGTPCQSFSVAGLRKGLEDPRGNLALVYCGILDHFKPRWFVWENVPGVLSSNGGRDFGSFLGAVAELGYGFAYRVLDAQYFGVAQRRRRVFVVGYLGDWEPAAKVLFEPESLRGNPAPSREKGKEVAGTIIRSTFGGGPGGKPESAAVGHFQAVTGSLTAKGPCAMGAPEVDAGHYLPVSTVGPLMTHHTPNGHGCAGINNQQVAAGHIIPQPINIYGGNKRPDRPEGGFYVRMDEETSKTLDAASGLNPTCSQGGTAVMQPVAVDVYNQAIDGQTAATLTEACGGTNTSGPKVMQAMAVRRLTPKECERLQGFPDNYTEIPWRGKTDTPDGPRYKALGNSMAVPVMKWIGERILGEENETAHYSR